MSQSHRLAALRAWLSQRKVATATELLQGLTGTDGCVHHIKTVRLSFFIFYFLFFIFYFLFSIGFELPPDEHFITSPWKIEIDRRCRRRSFESVISSVWLKHLCIFILITRTETALRYLQTQDETSSFWTTLSPAEVYILFLLSFHLPPSDSIRFNFSVSSPVIVLEWS